MKRIVRRFLGPALVIVVIAAIVGGFALMRDPAEHRSGPGPAATQATSTAPTRSNPPPSGDTANGNYAAMVLSDHPLAFWRLDDASEGTARDSAGHYPGTYMGSPRGARSLSSALGAGTSFDGVDDHVTANSLTQVTSWPGYTMEAWVQLSQETKEEHIVAFNTADGGNGPGLLHDQPTRKFKFRDCEGPKCAQVFSKTVPRLDVPYHLVVTVDAGGHGAFYVNGALQATFVTIHKPPRDGLFTIGGEYDAGPTAESFFTGEIGNVAVYAHPLDSATVQAHYQAGA